MTIEQTFKKAVEGGYDNDFGAGTTRFQEYPEWQVRNGLKMMTLDPSFWQSLGKALGWSDPYYVQWVDMNPIFFPPKVRHWDEVDGWKYQWHHFIDHLAQGRSAEEFFANITSPEGA